MNTQTVEGPTIKRLERSRSDRMLAGVSGGLASYFEIHPAFFRVGFVVLTLLGGAGIVIYLAAALVMPDEGKEDSVVSAALRERRDRPWPLIGLALLAIAGVILLSHATLWPGGDAWIVLLIAGAAILWITRQSKAVPSADAKQLAASDSRRIRRFFVALAVIVASFVALVLVAVAVFAAVVHVHVGHGIGERTYNVAGAQDLRDDYRLGIGQLILDLSDVELPAGETFVNARVDVGELRITGPPEVAVRIHGDTQFGDLNVFGDMADGHDVERSVTQKGERVLVLDAHVGAGSLRVARAVR
jgi:phage shock protein PspC (stress-responsive transcriptional regulator)